MERKEELNISGYSIIQNVFSDEESNNIIEYIQFADSTKSTFRKSKDVFAIRQILKELPQLHDFIFTDKIKQLIKEIIGDNFFIVKSIYFDKPESSNWFVAYHQDLTISVDKKIPVDGYGPWTIKQNQFAVQPPVEILNGICTIRIHLDDTDENNGALKIISGSHLNGITKIKKGDSEIGEEILCAVPKGGVMFMKPLLFHSSGRSTNNKRRRVIHMELSHQEIDAQLNWSERQSI